MPDASTHEIAEDEDDVAPKKRAPRDAELGRRKSIEEDLGELYEKIDTAFVKSAQRINNQIDYWHIYNCDTTENQFYQGKAKIYVPLARDAIDARVTRFTNQIFPSSGRNVEIVTTDGDLPFQMMALLEHYIEAAHLRDRVLPALLRNGDVEGHWNLYVSWNKTERTVAYKVRKPPELDGMEIDGAEEIEDIVEEVIPAMCPMVEVIPDTDIVVLPQTADSVEEALARGGSVTILRRWTKADLKRMAKEGEFIKSRADELINTMSSDKKRVDAKKKHVDSAGIVSDGKYVLGYETWTMLEVGGEKTLCRAYYGASDVILGCKQNPFWHNLCPLISAPVDKISGVFKGTSPVKKVDTFQYAANDFINQGADSATYALLPIIMTDPIKNPRLGSMVMDLAAVWEVDPNSTKFAEFPALWKDALELVSACKAQIFQSLGVNPSMIPGQTGGKTKKNQAEIANEQVVDVLTTADVVTALEAAILTPMIQMFAWLDAQFREEDITIRMYGRAGIEAQMQAVEPLQMNTRYWYKWLGVETARNMQQMQQQISTMNVLNGIPPEKYQGYKLNIVPLIERICESVYGARLAPQVFSSIKDQLSLPPQVENGMLMHGFDLPVSPMDNDAEHMQAHAELMPLGDPQGVVRVHMMKHAEQLKAKQQAQMPPPQGMPGKPGGAGPGVAGTPKPGAVPAGPHAAKGPNGAIHRDQMPLAPPRKF